MAACPTNLLILIFLLITCLTSAFDICVPIDDVSIAKLKLVALDYKFTRDDLFQEYWTSYYDGEFKAQIVSYPYGGGSIVSLRNRSAKYTSFGVKKIIFGVHGASRTTYYEVNANGQCRGKVPTRFEDVAKVVAYVPK